MRDKALIQFTLEQEVRVLIFPFSLSLLMFCFMCSRLFVPHCVIVKEPLFLFLAIPIVFHRTLTQASEVHTYNTRFAASLNFHRPKVNNNYGSSTFSFVASKFWEIFPTDFKKLPYTSFYKQYKLYLLNTQYYSSA